MVRVYVREVGLKVGWDSKMGKGPQGSMGAKRLRVIIAQVKSIKRRYRRRTGMYSSCNGGSRADTRKGDSGNAPTRSRSKWS